MDDQDVLVGFTPRPGERELVAKKLPRATWLVDGARDGRVFLSAWPRREITKQGLTWTDLKGVEVVKVITAGANHVGWSTLPPHLRLAATPGATGALVAEHVLAFILAWTRGIVRRTQDIRAGRFEVGAPVRGLAGLRVGLVGYGGIGQATAGLLVRLGCDVRAVSRSGRAAPPLARVGTMADLAGLAAWCDVLVLALPLHRDTQGLVDATLLGRMRPASLLVNVARGPIVDEDALYAWSQQEEHAAALDVWWTYPKEGHPFRRPFHELPNIMMTPHDAPNVPGHRLRMIEAACDDLRAFFGGAPLGHEQDRAAHTLRRE